MADKTYYTWKNNVTEEEEEIKTWKQKYLRRSTKEHDLRLRMNRDDPRTEVISHHHEN